MNTSKNQPIKTTPWVSRKMPKLGAGDKLAIVAEMMDNFTREENSKYDATCRMMSDMLDTDKILMDEQERMIRQHREAIQIMATSMRRMEEVINRQERELRERDPSRAFGYAVGRDTRNVAHVMMIEYPMRMDEIEIDQAIIDLVANEETDYDSDATIMEDNEI